jgi:hypothetical protein
MEKAVDVGVGNIGTSLYLPLNFAMYLKLFEIGTKRKFEMQK